MSVTPLWLGRHVKFSKYTQTVKATDIQDRLRVYYEVIRKIPCLVICIIAHLRISSCFCKFPVIFIHVWKNALIWSQILPKKIRTFRKIMFRAVSGVFSGRQFCKQLWREFPSRAHSKYASQLWTVIDGM